MSWKELIKSISRREWKIVALLSLLAMVLTAVPPVFGYLLGELRGTPWNGLQQLAPGDFSVYLSYIQQAKSGELLSHNLFTVEETRPAFNILWFSVGCLAAVLGLGNIVAFHLARLLLIPALAAVSYLATAFFLSKKKDRLLAFVVLFFGSGIGLYAAPLILPGLVPGSPQWPIDLWISEANIFASLSYSPHFVASWTLLLLSMLLLAMSFVGGRPRYGFWAGAIALVLFQFHPFHAPTMYAVGAVYLLIMIWRRTPDIWRSVAAYFAFLAVSAPSLLYHYVIMNSNIQAQEIIAANMTPTPWPWHLVLGFGVLSVAAPFGIRLARRGGAPKLWLFLSVWAGCHLTLVYAPLVFQQRLLEGLQFPLVMLSLPALLAVVGWLRRRLPREPATQQLIFVALFIVLFLPTTFRMVAGNIDLYWHNNPPLAFFSPAESAALDWIVSNTAEEATFMSAQDTGQMIAGWAGRRVLFGHWVNSGDVQSRTREVREFFSESSEQQRATIMHEKGLDYVYYGPNERQLGPLVEGEHFELVFDLAPIKIFHLR